MKTTVGRKLYNHNPVKEPAVRVVRKPLSSRLSDLGKEAGPRLPHACCSGEAGHCYPRIKAGS